MKNTEHLRNLLILASLSGLVAGVLLGGLPTYLHGQTALTDQKDAATAHDAVLLNDFSTKIANEKTRPSDPQNITTGDLEANYAGWKTYKNTTLGFTFAYPPTWSVVSTPADAFSESFKGDPTLNDAEELTPREYTADSVVREGAFSNVESISCLKDGTSAEDFATVLQTQTRNYQPWYVEATGVSGVYYVDTLGFDVQTFIVSHNGTLCELKKPTTDKSFFTKAEDGEGMGIINTFKFL